jgi:hypothetical protein
MATAKVLTSLLRANGLYELVLYDRLTAEERRALADAAKEPGFYGLLRPASPHAGLNPKSVDRDTALLFLTLREPGPLPAYVRTALGDGSARTIARLVADGVLEIEHEGAFVSGVAAAGLFQEASAGEGGSGRLAELSRAALRYGQALAVDDPLLLSWRLYAYNHRPLTPRWQRLLPSREAVERHLGIAPGEERRKLLDRRWTPTGSAAWLSWRARSRAAAGSAPAAGPTWKLYVSPLPEALADGFGAVLEALTAGRATHFKVGADAAGLLRPDKIVAYFPTFERLAAAAEVVTRRLDGAPAQGVPFTSEIGAGGLVSWGVDPADDSARDGESWRLWLTRRLARALLAARAAAAEGIEPWQFAVERLRLEGVDTDTWTPGALMWRQS